MICRTHKAAYPNMLYDQSTTSTENMDHKKGVSVFKRLKILESNHLFGYFSVPGGDCLDWNTF